MRRNIAFQIIKSLHKDEKMERRMSCSVINEPSKVFYYMQYTIIHKACFQLYEFYIPVEM